MTLKGETKSAPMDALADERGVICAIAMGQPGLKKPLTRVANTSTDEITPEKIAECKAAVTRILSPQTTAGLLHPEFAWGA